MSRRMSLHHRYRPHVHLTVWHIHICSTPIDVLYIVISVIRELHCVSIWLQLLLYHSCMSGEQKEARCRVGWWEGSCRLGVITKHFHHHVSTNYAQCYKINRPTPLHMQSSLWSKSCPPVRLVLPTARELQLQIDCLLWQCEVKVHGYADRATWLLFWMWVGLASMVHCSNKKPAWVSA